MRHQKMYACNCCIRIRPSQNPELRLGVLFWCNQPLVESSTTTMGTLIRNSLAWDEYHCHGYSKRLASFQSDKGARRCHPHPTFAACAVCFLNSVRRSRNNLQRLAPGAKTGTIK